MGEQAWYMLHGASTRNARNVSLHIAFRPERPKLGAEALTLDRMPCENTELVSSPQLSRRAALPPIGTIARTTPATPEIQEKMGRRVGGRRQGRRVELYSFTGFRWRQYCESNALQKVRERLNLHEASHLLNYMRIFRETKMEAGSVA